MKTTRRLIAGALAVACVASAALAQPKAPVYLDTGGRAQGATGVFALDASGNVIGGGYKLLTNASATGTAVSGVAGGSYVWCIQGTIGGATIALQALGPDGTNYVTVSSQTAAGCYGVVLGSNATVRATVTGGTPSGLYSSLS